MSVLVEQRRDEIAAQLVTISQTLQVLAFKANRDGVLSTVEARQIIRAAKGLYAAQEPLSRPFVMEAA